MWCGGGAAPEQHRLPGTGGSHPSTGFSFPLPLSSSVTISGAGKFSLLSLLSFSGQVSTAVQTLPDVSKCHHNLPSKPFSLVCIDTDWNLFWQISVRDPGAAE